ncbi:MAG TPA: glycoside hydrolase family 16 protein [Acidimicrobiia bacterium]|nr:glycoside hydrolase family 16 protein [Acidimicrobiia bacterium]
MSACLLGLGGPPAVVAAPAGVATAMPYGDPTGRWTLRFEDNFDGTSVDPSKWSPGFGWGKTSGHAEEYCAPENNVVGGGLLIQRLDNGPQHGKPFTAGCLHTKGKFSQLYGYFEARMKVPKGAGFVSAFWAKPESEAWPPELDVHEVLGARPDTVRMTAFWRDAGATHRAQGRWTGPDLSEGFHVFGADWGPTRTIWYVDGVERFRTTSGAGAMDDEGPFYVMLNTHIGTNFGGSPDATVIWPRFQLVDYVRVWARTPTNRP